MGLRQHQEEREARVRKDRQEREAEEARGDQEATRQERAREAQEARREREDRRRRDGEDKSGWEREWERGPDSRSERLHIGHWSTEERGRGSQPASRGQYNATFVPHGREGERGASDTSKSPKPPWRPMLRQNVCLVSEEQAQQTPEVWRMYKTLTDAERAELCEKLRRDRQGKRPRGRRGSPPATHSRDSKPGRQRHRSPRYFSGDPDYS